jgi:hypothetical protein
MRKAVYRDKYIYVLIAKQQPTNTRADGQEPDKSARRAEFALVNFYLVLDIIVGVFRAIAVVGDEWFCGCVGGSSGHALQFEVFIGSRG